MLERSGRLWAIIIRLDRWEKRAASLRKSGGEEWNGHHPRPGRGIVQVGGRERGSRGDERSKKLEKTKGEALEMIITFILDERELRSKERMGQARAI